MDTIDSAASAATRMDQLASLAAALLDAPAAQVSILTGVQTIGGGFGLSPEIRARPTPLNASLCTVTASCDAPLVVADARADARVAGLPPVTAGAVRSYLGVPLRTSDGGALGALCVFGPEVRRWSADDVAMLERLSEWGVAELTLGTLTRDFADSHQRWQLSIEAAGIGSFDWDLRTGHVQADERLLELFGLDAAATRAGAFFERVHPEDWLRVRGAYGEAVQGAGPYAVEHRVQAPDGAVRWVRLRGRVLRDASGDAVRLLGSALDTTDERDAEARAVRVIESMAAAFVSLDRDWRITYVNAEAEALLGLSRQELLGRDLWEQFPLAPRSEIESVYRRVVETRVAESFETFYGPPLNAWYEIRPVPSSDGLAVHFADVTARRQAEELVALSLTVSDRLSSAVNVDEALSDLARALVPQLADWTIVTIAEPDGRLRDVATWHADPASRPAADQYVAHRLEGRDDESFAAEVARTATPLTLPSGVTDIALDAVRSAPAREAIARLAPESAVVLPLHTGGRQRGALTLVRGAGRPPMDEQQLSVATTIAHRAGLALDNARLHAKQRRTAERLSAANARLRAAAEHQRSVAVALQEAMLTQLPQPDHLQLAARYLTADAEDQVGGDWYDAIMLPGGATLLTIGDVVGHDIRAAAVMGQLRNMLRMVAWDRDEPPSQLVTRLDHALEDLYAGTMATLLTLRIEQDEAERATGLRRLRWTAAGHPEPILIDAGAEAVLLPQHQDPMLGCGAGGARHDATCIAPPDSTLLLYTDGLVETRDRDVRAGQRRLLQIVTEHHGLPLATMLDAVIADAVGTTPADDVAVLAVRFGREKRDA